MARDLSDQTMKVIMGKLFPAATWALSLWAALAAASGSAPHM